MVNKKYDKDDYTKNKTEFRKKNRVFDESKTS